jgi:hypothetical protein
MLRLAAWIAESHHRSGGELEDCSPCSSAASKDKPPDPPRPTWANLRLQNAVNGAAAAGLKAGASYQQQPPDRRLAHPLEGFRIVFRHIFKIK